jgi:hypothetical protein
VRRSLTLADTDKRFNDARFARNYVRLQHNYRCYADIALSRMNSLSGLTVASALLLVSAVSPAQTVGEIRSGDRFLGASIGALFYSPVEPTLVRPLTASSCSEHYTQNGFWKTSTASR